MTRAMWTITTEWSAIPRLKKSLQKPFVAEGVEFPLWRVQREFHAAFVGAATAHLNTVLYALDKVKGILPQFELARFRFRQIQDVVDDREQVQTT